jgi:hypothetical protein
LDVWIAYALLPATTRRKIVASERTSQDHGHLMVPRVQNPALVPTLRVGTRFLDAPRPFVRP